VETYPRTGIESSRAAETTGRNRSIDSAIEAFTFFRLNVSDAAVNTAIFPTFARSARSRPRSLGTSAEYRVDPRRWIRWNTSSASWSWGTRSGETKALTSISS